MPACRNSDGRAHVHRAVGSEADLDKSREQAFRPPDGGELGEHMTSAVTSATTSSVASVATADDLGWNHFGGPVLYVPFGWAEPYDGATLDYEWGSIDNNPARPHGVAGGFKGPASTGRTEALSMAAKPT